MRFKHLINRILGFKVPLIICFRGEEKTRMEKNDRGRNTVVTDTTTTPIFDKKFIFEAHIAIECFQIDGRGGFIRFPMPYAKTSHADIRALLPKEGAEQLSVAHGEALAKWCAAPSGPGTQPQLNGKPADDERKTVFAELWAISRPVRGNAKDWSGFQAWAIKSSILGESDPAVLEMDRDVLRFVIQKTKEVMQLK